MLNLDGEDIVEEVAEEEKPEKFNPFTFVEAISYTKDLSLFEEHGKHYTPFLVNRSLSFYPDTIIQANAMNKYPDLDKDMQFRFLTDLIRKKKRYGGWIKKDKMAEKIEVIKTFYKYSTAKALNVADLLSDADITVMKQRMSTGGLHARPQKPTRGVSVS